MMDKKTGDHKLMINGKPRSQLYYSIENSDYGSITNSPAVTLPVGHLAQAVDNMLPVGLEILGVTGSDEKILQVAHSCEKIFNN